MRDNESYLMAPGTVVGGKYEILKKIGSGGMSNVYLVMDNHLNKNWALKEVRKDEKTDFDYVKNSVIVETEMLKKLSHPHLPRIVDVIDTGGVFYVIMDYIEGQTLEAVLSEYGAQSQEDVVKWALVLADVLNYLHSQKPPIIYRDMKPDNIMLKPEGEIVLFDFGIAREYQKAESEGTKNLGTEGYAAPEQYEEDFARLIDARTDIYALGATMFHLVTGINPKKYNLNIPDIREKNPALSPGLEGVIKKCVSYKPEDRFQNAAELIYALENLDHYDGNYKKKLRHKIAASAVPFVLSLLCFGIAAFSGIQLKEEQKNNYNQILSTATDMATQSYQSGEYNAEVLEQFIMAIDVDSSRRDAYLRLLDYCSRINETQAGLDVACARIDAGIGGIDKDNDVLLRVAQLYFGGVASDADFTRDYTKAAKYFGLIDQKEVPEARYYAGLSNALGSFSQDISWGDVKNTLEEFEEYNDRQVLSEEKIRNYQLAAGVYTASKREFQSLNIDPYEKAINILDKALSAVENLERDANAENNANLIEQVALFRRQIINDLGTAYYTAFTIDSPMTDFDKAIEYYEELIDITDSETEIEKLESKILDIISQQGDDNKTREHYESMIAHNPSNVKLRLNYAAYLLEHKDAEAAREQFDKVADNPEAKMDSNYGVISQKLENAGASGGGN
ncbi:MAG: protein kinase [Lachnospiraceae bacterium]|nr:protein kinase [Lachnospiraceae bacterium]